VDRGGREPGAVRELLQRPAALGPRLGDLGAEGRDRLLDLGGEMGLVLINFPRRNLHYRKDRAMADRFLS
jgi:hypothetical protein